MDETDSSRSTSFVDPVHVPICERSLFPAGSRWLLPALFLTGLVLRLLMVWQNQVISRDGLHYVQWARLITSGQWQGIAEKYFLNPYPWLISLVARTGIDHQLAGQLISTICAAVAIVPLALWCNAAFGRRIGELVALIYAVHPSLVRISSEVLREGLYWLLSFTALALLWSAARRNCGWRFGIGGLVAIAATLTRVEGVLLFLLAGMWWVARLLWCKSDWRGRSWKPALTVLSLSAVVLLIAVVLVPAADWDKWQLVTMATDYVAAHKTDQTDHTDQTELNPTPHAQDAWQRMDARDSLKLLANGLPAYQIKQYRLLDLAKDHLWPVYMADFTEHLFKAFEFPILLFFLVGLWWGRRQFWHPVRDVPLAIYSAVVACILLHHLATMHVMSMRYAFAFIPLVLPWSAMGIVYAVQATRRWLAKRELEGLQQPWTVMVTCVLIVVAMGKMYHGSRDSKFAQRRLGELLRETCDAGTVIAGPRKFRRVGFYADALYATLPQTPQADFAGWMQEHAAWLREQNVEFLLFDPQELTAEATEELKQQRDEVLQPVFSDHPQFKQFRVYHISGLPAPRPR